MPSERLFSYLLSLNTASCVRIVRRRHIKHYWYSLACPACVDAHSTRLVSLNTFMCSVSPIHSTPLIYQPSHLSSFITASSAVDGPLAPVSLRDHNMSRSSSTSTLVHYQQSPTNLDPTRPALSTLASIASDQTPHLRCVGSLPSSHLTRLGMQVLLETGAVRYLCFLVL